MLSVAICFCFPLSTDAVLPRRLFGETGGFAFLAGFCLDCGRAGSLRGEVLEGRALGDGVGLEGAGTGGSLGLWTVRACLVGGGARIAEKRFGAWPVFLRLAVISLAE